jgi:hypothetical protein
MHRTDLIFRFSTYRFGGAHPPRMGCIGSNERELLPLLSRVLEPMNHSNKAYKLLSGFKATYLMYTSINRGAYGTANN